MLEELKAEVAKLQNEPYVMSTVGPELMAIAEDGSDFGKTGRKVSPHASH